MPFCKHHSVYMDQVYSLVFPVIAFILCMKVCDNTGLVVSSGKPVVFNCSVESKETSLWQIQRSDNNVDAIAQDGLLYSAYKPQFSLVVREESSGTLVIYHQILTLINATARDDGRYICEEDGQRKTETDLTVEVPPVLHLEMDNTVISTTSSIDVLSGQTVIITCVAEGGKPLVSLSWRVNGEEKTGLLIDDPPPRERTVTSILHYQPSIEDNTITCVTSGQQVIPEKEVSIKVNVQYSPNCVMAVTNTSNAFVISCSCNANPGIERYQIYVNGSLFSEDTKATLPSQKPATVFCKATNDVGTYTTETENLKVFHEDVPIQLSGSVLVIGLVVAAVIIIVLLSIATVAVCMYRKKIRDAEEGERWATMNQDIVRMSMKPLPDFLEENEPLKEDAYKAATEVKTNGDHEESKETQDQSDGLVPDSTPPEETKQEEDNLLEVHHKDV